MRSRAEGPVVERQTREAVRGVERYRVRMSVTVSGRGAGRDQVYPSFQFSWLGALYTLITNVTTNVHTTLRCSVRHDSWILPFIVQEAPVAPGGAAQPW